MLNFRMLATRCKYMAYAFGTANELCIAEYYDWPLLISLETPNAIDAGREAPVELYCAFNVQLQP